MLPNRHYSCIVTGYGDISYITEHGHGYVIDT